MTSRDSHVLNGAVPRIITGSTYLPSPVKRVEIPKSTGGKRPLGIPTVVDRLIQKRLTGRSWFVSMEYRYKTNQWLKEQGLVSVKELG
jgi:hypothetical protein